MLKMKYVLTNYTINIKSVCFINLAIREPHVEQPKIFIVLEDDNYEYK